MLPLFFFFVLPFLRLFWLSVWSDGGPTLGLYADLAASERVRAGILNTIGIVGASTLLASSVGLVQAWLITHTDIRRKKIPHRALSSVEAVSGAACPQSSNIRSCSAFGSGFFGFGWNLGHYCHHLYG